MKFLKENAVSIVLVIALTALVSVSQIHNDKKQTAKAEKQDSVLVIRPIETK